MKLVKLAQRFNVQIQVLYYEKYIFPQQKDYMEEISQLLVHTLEEMRTKEGRMERAGKEGARGVRDR